MKLPKFNREITVTVDVDQIMDKLVNTFPEDYKHRELVSHAIVGTAVNNGGLSYIYHALNGYSPEINFEIGDAVRCSSKERRVNKPKDDGGYDKTHEEIGVCEVVDIDYYSKDKLKVMYEQHKNFGSQETEIVYSWVSHNNCERIVAE